jgi:hypothetical protein
MQHNDDGFDLGYPVTRYNFICKVSNARASLTIANNRWEIPARKSIS